MTDAHGPFPELDPQPVGATDQPERPFAPAPMQRDRVADEAVAEDGFDRGRVLRLLDRLERDVAAVETAMVHVEAGEHEACAAAVATIDVHLVD